MNVNGIILVSAVLNFQTTDFTPGNDLPYILFLPSYTATAWYHKKLPEDLQLYRSRTFSSRWKSSPGMSISKPCSRETVSCRSASTTWRRKWRGTPG